MNQNAQIHTKLKLPLQIAECEGYDYSIHWPFPEFREGSNYEDDSDLPEGIRHKRLSGSSSLSDETASEVDNISECARSETPSALFISGSNPRLSVSASDMSALHAFRKAQLRASSPHSTQTCAKIKPHPLASDWNLETKTKSFRDHIRHEISKTALEEAQQLSTHVQTSHLRTSNRVQSALSDRLTIIAPESASTNTKRSSPSDDSRHFKKTPENKTRVAEMLHLSPALHGRHSSQQQGLSVDDMTLLIRLFEDDPKIRRGCASTDSILIRHMSLDWLGKRLGFSKQVVPPLVNLHLGNFASVVAKCDGEISGDRILINSPRSAIVLLRNGISVVDLIPRPAVVKRTRMMTTQETLKGQSRREAEDLTRVLGNSSALILSKTEEEIERLRLHRLSRLVAEYIALCSVVSQEEIIKFCNEYDKARPSSAFRINGKISCSFLHSSGGQRSIALPETVAEEKFQKVFDRHASFERTVVNCQQKVIADDEAKRLRAAERLRSETARSKRLLASRESKLEQMRTERSAKEALKKLQQSSVDRARAYRVSTLREPVLRRDDEVQNIEQARQNAIQKYKKVVVNDIHKDAIKEMHVKAARENKDPRAVSWAVGVV